VQKLTFGKSAVISALSRLVPLISFGTEGYPEKVARRMRIVTAICWLSAVSLYFVALRRLFGPEPGNYGQEPATVATMFLLIPLLHKVSSVAAFVVLIVLAYVDTWRVSFDGGTDGGYWLATIAGSALAVWMLGADRPYLSFLLALLSGVTAVAILIVIPGYTGGQTVEDQYTSLVINVVRTHIMLFAVGFFGARQIARAEATAELERDRSDNLLVNILPAAIADRLKREPGKKVADRYDEASVLFADMAGFTRRVETMQPAALIKFLDDVFSSFDRLVEKHGLEKIKTTGDAYMVVSGVPVQRADHAEALTALGLDMLDAARKYEAGVPIRIGIASGPVVAGVVGARKFFYDVWGDPVNVAARMESSGEAGRIHVAPDTASRLARDFLLEPRGNVEIKGKGPMQTSFVIGRRPVDPE